MTTFKRIFLVALLGAGLALAGCGDDDEGAPIPSDTAVALQSELDGIQARLDEGSAGACRDVLEGPRGPNIDRVRELIDSMPDNVDPDVRSALEGSFDRLWELVQQDCEEKASQEEEEPEPEPDPVPTETETTPTETAPPEEDKEEEEAPPPEEELPPDGDGDSGGGVPGVGNGGGVGPGGVEGGE